MLSQELKDALSMENMLPAKYEEAQDEEKPRNKQEDFSDMVAEISENLLNKQEDFSEMVAENVEKRWSTIKEKYSESKKAFKF